MSNLKRADKVMNAETAAAETEIMCLIDMIEFSDNRNRKKMGERLKSRDLTQGPVTMAMVRFAVPMILGNLLQQCYNVADTLIVGRYIGRTALAAVGSSYTLMTFLTSILLGLCMGSGTLFSIRYGEEDKVRLQNDIYSSFILISCITVLMNVCVFLGIDPIIKLMQVPEDVYPLMREYLMVIFAGIVAVFLYNYFAALLRSIGNSVLPLVFLAISAVMNIVLDLWFIIGLDRGVAGAAEATIIAQYCSGVGIMIYTWVKFPEFRIVPGKGKITKSEMKEIGSFSVLTCVQQSVMNFGILMVQGLVNSFGSVIMAAFAAAVKIDSFAYMPVQDFGNAFSTFIAQNYGAKKYDRINKGLKSAVIIAIGFCVVVSAVVFIFGRQFMLLFVKKEETEVIFQGIRYLRIEGAFYCGIGCLFLLYGLYRALGKPDMSVVLTVISLGTRVALAYILASIPAIGVVGIWWSVPIGWLLADIAGFAYYLKNKSSIFPWQEEETIGNGRR